METNVATTCFRCDAAIPPERGRYYRYDDLPGQPRQWLVICAAEKACRARQAKKYLPLLV